MKQYFKQYFKNLLVIAGITLGILTVPYLAFGGATLSINGGGGGTIVISPFLFNASNQIIPSVLTANLGVATNTPSQPLSIQGGGLFSGNVTMANLTATGTLTVQGTGTSTFSGSGINVTAGCLAVNGVCASALATPITVANGGTGSTTLGGILVGNGTSAISATGTISVFNGGTGSTTLGGWLTGAGTGNVTSGTITNDTNVTGTIAGSVITLGWQSSLSVARGGTGSTTLSAGAVLFGNGTGGVGAEATSSVTYNSPLTTSGTAGYILGGSAFTVGCQTASGSQAGCLASADWTTFNNKAGFGWPFTSSTNYGNNTGQSTTTFMSFTNGMAASTTSYFVNASTTQFTIASGGALYIPNAATAPIVSGAGQIAIETTVASSSLSVATTSANSAFVLYPSTDASGIFASSTLAYIGAFSATASTTLNFRNPVHPIRMTNVFCQSNGGTVNMEMGTGAATTTMIVCTTAGVNTLLSTNNTWTEGQPMYVTFGDSGTGFLYVTPTWTIKQEKD